MAHPSKDTYTHHGRAVRVSGIAAALVFTIASVSAQPAPEPKQGMSDKVFKNVVVLKGIPVNEFMATMGFISASLGMTCTDCHVLQSAGSWEKYADDTPLKQTARRMLVMASAINKTYFGGKREVTCYSCHRGGERPRVTPSLAEMYGPPPVEEPDDLRKPLSQDVTADQILDKYINALGGAQKLGALTSYTAKGTYKGFSDTETHPLELIAKAPNQRSTTIHTLSGDTTTTYDGHAGWTVAPIAESPVKVLELTGGDLDAAMLDAVLCFPTGLKQTLKQWRVGVPTNLDGHDVQLLQGTIDGKHPVNLYFDSKSGLLARQVRYTESPIGLNPTQIDYSDYRDVAGVKMPFKWMVTWLDGRATTELTDVQANASVDAAKFAKPKTP